METIAIPELEEDKQEYKNPFANGFVSNYLLFNYFVKLVWKTRIDATTGKLCFYNQLTKKVQFNKPVGLKVLIYKIYYGKLIVFTLSFLIRRKKYGKRVTTKKTVIISIE